jgi:hypothetical protein
MRELRVLREVEERLARRAAGLNPIGPRLYPIQIQTAGIEHDILALPENVDDLTAIQNSDSSFVFMLDYSALDGPDGLA